MYFNANWKWHKYCYLIFFFHVTHNIENGLESIISSNNKYTNMILADVDSTKQESFEYAFELCEACSWSNFFCDWERFIYKSSYQISLS